MGDAAVSEWSLEGGEPALGLVDLTDLEQGTTDHEV